MSDGPRICMVGSSNTDLVARIPRLPRQGECLTGTDFAIGFGGKGANQAVMAARLGGRVTVITRVGCDLFGATYRAHYETEGIDTSCIVEDPARGSGVAMILVEEPTGRNTIAFVPGANGGLSPEDVIAHRDVIAEADVVLCQLEVPILTTLEACRIAREGPGHHPIVILNTAPVPVPPIRLPSHLLRSVDVLVANEEEGAYLAEEPIDTVDQALQAAALLAERWDLCAVLTLGPRGVVMASPELPARLIPVRQVQAVDTTGAGDAFVGSLAVLVGSGEPMERAVERAAAVATLSVLGAGTQASFPRRSEVRAALGW
jgi:ribokinase